MRNGAASIRKPRCAWPTVDPQAIGATFDGNGTFEFSEPRKFVIHNRSHGYARAGAVAMTGTIDATIVGDDYRYDHDNTFPGFRLEGKMAGHIKRGAATLSTMSGPAHAYVTDVAAAARSAATLGFPVADIMFEVHGGIDAPMTLGGSYRYPEIETTIAGDAVDLPLHRPRRGVGSRRCRSEDRDDFGHRPPPRLVGDHR